MKKLMLMSLLAALSGGGAMAQNTFPPTGNTGLGTLAPVSLLHVQNGCVIFDVPGLPAPNPISGAGGRMMWIPDKSAFRAGFVAGAEWDNVNVGKNSGAFCYTTTASGDASFAINSRTEASGDGAFAANGDTRATAQYATAFGDGASATGYASLATGQSTVSAGSNSFSAGASTDVQGDAAAAFGVGSIAAQYAAFATGNYTQATAPFSAAFGSNSIASQENAFATGNTTDASGTNAAAFGDHSAASGNNSFATGASTQVSGTNSAAFGANTNVVGDNSFAAGSSTNVTADNAAAFGENTTASGPSAFTIGTNTQASNVNAFASGNGSQASGLHSVAMGNNARATSLAAISLGSNTRAMADYTTAIGSLSQANALNAISIGNNSIADGVSSMALGTNSYAGNTQSVAIGTGAISTGVQASAIGFGSSAQGAGAMAIGNGYNAQAIGNNSIAIGGNTMASANSIAINGNADNFGTTGSFCYSDMDANVLQNSANNQFMARATGGFVLQNSPTYIPLQTVTFDGGNLGVGTGRGNATDKLDVNGTLRIRTIPINNVSTDILVRDVNGVVNTRSIPGLGGSEWSLLPGGVPTTINQDIYRNGIVGIGTNSPQAKLHVINPPCSSTPGIRVTATTSAVVCAPPSFPGNLIQADGYDGNMTVVAPKFVVTAFGNVGVNTNTPKMLMDLVRGDILFRGSSNTAYRLHNQHFLTNGIFAISPSDSNGVMTGSGGLTLNPLGNIGMGVNPSSNPADRLMVNGNAIPASNCAFTLGTSLLRWNLIFLCNNPVIMSDARLKTNIQNSEYGIEEIKRLRPVTYNLTTNEDEGRKIGLIAQEAKEVISEIVHVGDDADKMMGIKYSELIPVLITAVQQQQTMIDDLKKQVEQLQAGNTNNSGNNGNNTSADDAVLNGVKLYQNTPNPFNTNTEIRYYLPEKVKQAAITIFDLNGRQLRSYDIAQRGDGSVVVHGEELMPGMYLYSLIVEGREADTKRMVLSK